MVLAAFDQSMAAQDPQDGELLKTCLETGKAVARQHWESLQTSTGIHDSVALCDTIERFVKAGSCSDCDADVTGANSSIANWFQRALAFAVCACYELASKQEHPWYSILSDHTVRVATSVDIPALLRLIKELAEFEKEPDAVVIDEKTLLQDGFSSSKPPLFHVLVLDNASGDTIGFALCFITYSTWTGRNAYLEDLYITPGARRSGLGTMLIDALTMAAYVSGCARLSWQALDWNTPAVRCYEKLGAKNEDQWLNFKLHQADLDRRVHQVTGL
jgi:GNAT superfamily N-acetyltransferase